MASSQVPFEPRKYYHILNHANGSDNIFIKEDNYRYFLEKFVFYISPIAEIYAYCLMPNHFHFLIRIKDEKPLTDFFIEKLAKPSKSSKLLDGLTSKLQYLVSRQFSDFFNAYAQAFNKVHHRKGSLFAPNLKRKPINTDSHFRNVVHYIHYNPVYHGFRSSINDWTYSSYKILISSEPTFLKREATLEWFGGRENFIFVHSGFPDNDISFE